ncbi:MAG TPA: DNA gyrase modulator, partial [Candidatus Bathyarchaeia archaeon]|nr:DNA gyrase modulator [Candidatus Bathyarchaeia archaeon]
MKDILAKTINEAEKLGAEYAEARAETLFKTMLTLKEGRVEAAKQGTEEGIALRVLVSGAWGFASVGSTNAEILKDSVSEACKMAKAASLRLKNPLKLAKTSVVDDRVRIKPRKNPSEVCMED